MKNRFVSLACVLLMMSGVFVAVDASAQDSNIVKEAQNAVYSEDWKAATNSYKQLVSAQPENPTYHSMLGKCYVNLREKDQAITELKKANDLYTDKQKAKGEAQANALLLAHTLKENGQPDEGIKVLEGIDPYVKNSATKELIAKEIEACKVAKEILANPKDDMVLNLGAYVNTADADHSCVLSKDKKQLFFTSNSKSGDKPGEGAKENVVVSNLVDSTKTYGQPKKIDGEVNVDSLHNAVIAISPDGSELYTYREDDNGTIFVSKKNGSSWSAPEPLDETINTPYMEKAACLSPDGQKLYFTSDRPGTLGGLDIWVSQRQGDTWGPATNLGSAVNTNEDEEGPYVSADGSKLYFSSKGHNAIGGYDIFSSAINNDSFGEAENLGSPINSVDDELYVSQDGKKLYYASNRKDGMGDYDLYVAGPTSVMTTAATALNGLVRNCHGDLVPSQIVVRDNCTATTQNVTPDAQGNFTINTFRGHNYTMTVSANGREVFSRLFDVAVDAPAQLDFWDSPIQLDPEKGDCKAYEEMLAKQVEEVENKNCEDGVCYDRLIEIEDIVFGFAKADPISSNKSLDELAEYLKEFPKAKIQVTGYADAAGSSSLNYTLARKRALTAQNYLKSKKVNAKQIEVVSLGEENPLSFNKVNGELDENSKKFNRRLEFRVVNQGDKTLLIRAVRNIPSNFQNPDYKRDYKKASGMPETNI